MCGIVGVCEFSGEAVADGVLRRMTDRIAHRGPDAEGQYVDGSVGLGNRRLSIIDLSPAGHQPMASDDMQVVLTYNGEIYNFPQLRVELEALGFAFHSRSDTEVLLHAYEAWGLDVFARLNGHFACALWDRRTRQLVLARDRFGVKPLYYLDDGRRFLFASEIKSLLAHPAVTARLSKAALNEYFAFQNIFSDRTLFDGVRLLPAGHLMIVDAGGGRVEHREYWDYRFAPEAMTFDDAVDAVAGAFDRAVTRQLISDVPVGSYLSGGIDSGSIVAVASRSAGRLSTFTCGFDMSSASGLEIGFDERVHAESLANLFKTEHYEVVLHAGDMECCLREVIEHLEDLRVGQSYPNYFAAKLASRFVRVVLSGVGGDELFGGYPWRYRIGAAEPRDFHRAYYGYWQRLVRDEEKPRFFTAETWSAVKDESLFELFSGVVARSGIDVATQDDALNAALYFELKTFLAGLLIVEDRLSMAHSLESRAPFLDNDLVDLALRIPVAHKMRLDAADINVSGKAVLREALRRFVPGDTASRAKQGFSAPDATWFRGESIEYVRRVLLAKDARLFAYIDRAAVERVIEEHCSGHFNHRLLIWSLLSFETWCEVFLDSPASS